MHIARMSARGAALCAGLCLGVSVYGVAALAQAAPAQEKPEGHAGTSTAQPAGQTTQQLFQAGSQALEAENYEEALRIFSALEPRVVRNARSTAIVQVRKGRALVGLGRRSEARQALVAGLASLPAGESSLRVDRYLAETGLARIALTELDYAEALAHYGLARAIAQEPEEKLQAMIGQVETGMFVDPQATLPIADEAATLLSSMSKPAASYAGRMSTVRGRLLMNLGRFDEAEKELAKAVAALGGLTLKVDYSDVVSRSDAAIAATLAGHKDKALEYLVYTGAGRLPKQDFSTGVDMVVPNCGEGGVTPEDVAVVELGIADNGSVAFARPIYASRQGDMGLIFARQVAQWSWRPEQVKDIPLLFRLVTRLELRCSTNTPPPSLFSMAPAALMEWANNIGAKPFQPLASDAARQRVEAQEELDRRRKAAGPTSPDLAPVLAVLVMNKIVSQTDRLEMAGALRAIAAPRPMPGLARFYLDHLKVDDRNLSHSARDAMADKISQAYRDYPQAYAVARLSYYDDLLPREKIRNAALLDELASDNRITGSPLMRTALLIRRASLRARLGDLAGAQADFAATGLTEQQCSIVDARPQARSTSGGSADYPMEIIRRGIEGWTKIAFDIAADGKTLNQRAVASYPPFIFGNAGEKIMRSWRFEQSYRPEGGPGCSGSDRGFIFKMPN